MGFTDDFEAAKVETAKSGRNVLAVFSGSDWCQWCEVLEERYLSKPEFVEEAKKDFVLVFIDNPHDKSVLSETAKKNELFGASYIKLGTESASSDKRFVREFESINPY